MIQLWSKI